MKPLKNLIDFILNDKVYFILLIMTAIYKIDHHNYASAYVCTILAAIVYFNYIYKSR